MIRLIQYCRKSSEGDERQVHSLPDQKQVLERLAEKRGLSIVARVEESKSAKLPGIRPVFTEMLAMIQRGEADGILIWHLNRLSRNRADSGMLEHLLQTEVIKCIVTPEKEYLPGDNILVMAVEGAMSNQYIVDMKKDIRRQLDEKAARGWYPYKAKPGYLVNPTTSEVEVDPVRFDLLRRAMELILTGGYLAPEVLEKLTEWGYRTKKGNPMAKSQFYKILDDRFYCGEFSYQGEQFDGKHKPMITREEFERIQAVVHRHYHIQPQKHSFSYTGLIHCGGCGGAITAERKIKHYKTTGRTGVYVYYRCSRKRPCSQPAVTEETIEMAIQGRLNEVLCRPETAELVKPTILRELGNDSAWGKTMSDSHSSELERQRQRLARLLDLRLSGELTSREYMEAKIKGQAEIDRLSSALERLSNQSVRARSSFANALDFATRAHQLYPESSEKGKRITALRLASNYVLIDGRLEMTVHPLLVALKGLEPPKGGQQQIQVGSSTSSNPLLWAKIDNILTLLRNPDISFEQLDSHLKSEDDGHAGAYEPRFSDKSEASESLAR